MSYECCGDGRAVGKTFTETLASLTNIKESPNSFILYYSLIGLGIALLTVGYWFSRLSSTTAGNLNPIGQISTRAKVQENYSPVDVIRRQRCPQRVLNSLGDKR